MKGLQVKNISKSYETTQVLHNISFDVKVGDIVAVLGPSGCGKSTLLSIIAGIEKPEKGEILWNRNSQNDIPPHERNFGLMFQDYMLFPHKNVAGNIAFGLEMLGWGKDEVNERVNQVLDFVGIPNYGDRRISTLSGGEQQRTALARSLAPRPYLLLLDEPISSLDRTLRERLLIDLPHILKRLNQTAIYVTHDQEEAFALADEIVVMNEGQIIQAGTPEDIYTNPKTELIARFLGFRNIFTAIINDNKIQSPIGRIPIRDIGNLNLVKVDKMDGTDIKILIRPDAMSEFKTQKRNATLNCIILERSFRGSLCQLDVSVENHNLRFDLQSSSTIPKPGEQAKLFFSPGEAFHFLMQ